MCCIACPAPLCLHAHIGQSTCGGNLLQYSGVCMVVSWAHLVVPSRNRPSLGSAPCCLDRSVPLCMLRSMLQVSCVAPYKVLIRPGRLGLAASRAERLWFRSNAPPST
jgi:hypothetical protein